MPVSDWDAGICDACKTGPNIIMQGHASMLDAFVAAEEAITEADRIKAEIRKTKTALNKHKLLTLASNAVKDSKELKLRGKRIKKAQAYKAKNKGADVTDEVFQPRKRRTI